MLKTSFIPLDREQYALLREAKRLILKEFEQELKLQSKDVLDKLYAFALESKEERLFNIFSELHASQEAKRKAKSEPDSNIIAGQWAQNDSAKNQKKSMKNIQIGDVVDGKRCTGFYRGNPVFEALKNNKT